MNRLLRLSIVRHGETNLNFKSVCQGHTDGKLTQKGITQASQLGQSLADRRYDKVYVSDLSRAVDTCQGILSNNRNFTESESNYKKLTLIRERFYGDADGVLPVADYIQDANDLGIPLRLHMPAENAETVEQMGLRIRQFVDRHLVPDSEKVPQNPVPNFLVVSHAIFLKEMVTYLKAWGGSTSPKIIVANLLLISCRGLLTASSRQQGT